MFTVYRCVLSNCYDITSLGIIMLPEIIKTLKVEQEVKLLFKFHYCLQLTFEKETEDGLVSKTDYFSTKLKPVLQSDDIDLLAAQMLQILESQIDQYSQTGSGW